MPIHFVRFARVIALALVFASDAGVAQEATEATADAALDRAAIEAQIASLESLTDTDDGTRGQVIAEYRKAIAALKLAETFRETEARYNQQVAGGRTDIEAEIDALAVVSASAAPAPDRVEASTSQEILPRLEQAKAEAGTLASQFEKLQRDLTAEADRPARIRAEIADADASIARLRAQLTDVDADAGMAAQLKEARRTAIRADIAAQRASVDTLRKELVSNPQRLELLQARRDRVQAERRLADAWVLALEQRLGELQRQEALKAIADTGVELSPEVAGNPLVRDLRDANLQTALIYTELTGKTEQARKQRDNAASEANRVSESFESAERKLMVVGSNQVVGQILEQERRYLPFLPDFQAAAAAREQEVSHANLQSLELKEALEKLQPVDDWLQALLGDSEPGREVTRALRSLATKRVALLNQTLGASQQYLQTLAEVSLEEQRVIQVTTEFDAFLAERLLWIRTTDPFGLDAIEQLPGDIRRFLDPEWWAVSVAAVGGILLTVPGAILLVAMLVFLGLRQSMVANLLATGEGVGKPSVDSFSKTRHAVGWTVLLAFPAPFFIYALGFAASRLQVGTAAPHELGGAMMSVAPLVFFLDLLVLMVMPGGLADVHFRWDSQAIQRLSRQLKLLWITVVLPAAVWLIALEHAEQFLVTELVRSVLVLVVLGLVFFTYRLLHPRRGIRVLIDPRTTREGGLLGSWLPFAIAVAIPLTAVGAAAYGYLYSASALMRGYIQTLWLGVGLVVLNELIARWLLVARRRIQLRQVLERREAAREAAEKAAQGAEVEESVSAESSRRSADAEVNLTSLDADTRLLVRVAVILVAGVGLLTIWSELLPALTVLEGIALWHTDAGVPEGGALREISLRDALLALILFGLTVVGAQTLPSVIEIALRQRSNVVRGTRLAFATLSRYAVVVFGVLVALNLLGASWSRLQWLVAALSVGIGFGLQEIVANFISGLIILIERPIRVGDVVTVGEVEGVVTRIQIRATTVMNWDRQEFLVPNREFITGRVLNWSLSDELTRVVVPVGIAYGSDADKAGEIIVRCASEDPRITNEPAPFYLFHGFGDNALNLELRCYVPRIDDRLSVITGLHSSIYKALAAAGIEIAFPQRDVHLDTRGPIEISLQRGGASRGDRDAT